jgi:hypothetical protein
MRKRQQIGRLKAEKKWKEMIKAIQESEIMAFGDIRNIMFDREIGTNIITDMVTKEREKDLILLLREIKQTFGLEMVQALTNVPNMQGDTVGLNVI